MAIASSSPGCLVYFFLAALTAYGYFPLGRHGADFSADSKKLAYKYNEREVRIRDLETGKSTPALYTAPEDWIINTVHWSDATGMVYAVVHDDPTCKDDNFTRKWTVRLVSVDPAGGASRTVSERSYFCITNDFMSLDSESQDMKPSAAYQNIKNTFSFKPTGWDSGKVYFIDPEEFSKDKPLVKTLDLLTGKESDAFTLPPGGYSHILSPDAGYLVSMFYDETGDAKRITLEVRKMPSQEVVLSRVVAQIPCTGPAECDEPGTGLWVLSGAEGAATFDEAAGQMFFLMLDAKTPATELHALDLKTKKTRLVYKSPDITFFLPVPQKKALLLTAANESAMDLLDVQDKGPDALMQASMSQAIATRLVSYEGKVLREYKSAPPMLSAYMNAVRPDVALSPDGNMVVLTAVNMYAEGSMDDPMGTKPITLPAILHLDTDTFEFIITEPVDNALAGLLLNNLGFRDAALPYLQALPRSLWAESKLTRSAVFALMASQRRAGKTDQAKATYSALIEQLKPLGDPHQAMAVGYYTTLTGDEPLSESRFYSALKIEDLPAFADPVSDADRKFIMDELEAAAPSWQADYMLASLAVHEQRWADAASLLQSALDRNRETADADGLILSMDFLLGQVYEKAGQYEKSLSLFENAQADLRDIALATAPVLEKLGRYQEAAEAYSYMVGALKDELEFTTQDCAETVNLPGNCEAETKRIRDKIKKYEDLRAAMHKKAQ
jgi:tetratricopeptide (TPR) repeat protein